MIKKIILTAICSLSLWTSALFGAETSSPDVVGSIKKIPQDSVSKMSNEATSKVSVDSLSKMSADSFKLSGDAPAKVSYSSYKPSFYGKYNEKLPNGFWELKGGAGLSMGGASLDGAILATHSTLHQPGDPTGFNTLTQNNQILSPLFYLSLQKTFVIGKTGLYSLSIGPAMYYQQNQSAGFATLNLDSSAANFNYSFATQAISALLELQWTPIVLGNFFSPYLIMGAGANSSTITFNTTPNPILQELFIPPNVNTSQWGFALDAGVGAEILFSQHWGLDLRYVYLKNFNAKLSGASVTGPVEYDNGSHNFLLSLVCRIGFT